MKEAIDFAAARRQLIEMLRREIKDEKVLGVMSKVPRERFVPPEIRSLAYEDCPLPIGFGQTISQPFIVALMTSALELKSTDKVLELGTGSGYQAAILAELSEKVITVERVPQLAERAKKLLDELGYNNIEVHIAEKTLGWEREAPYDAIIVTAGAPQIPPSLVKQLKKEGRMVIPVGGRYDQELLKITKIEEKKIKVENLGACRFVPLIGEEAWPEEEFNEL